MKVLSCGLLWAKSIKHFGDYERHFPHATYAKILAVCTRVCHRRWRNLLLIKKEKLSHIMGAASIVELARAYGLHP